MLNSVATLQLKTKKLSKTKGFLAKTFPVTVKKKKMLKVKIVPGINPKTTILFTKFKSQFSTETRGVLFPNVIGIVLEKKPTFKI